VLKKLASNLCVQSNAFLKEFCYVVSDNHLIYEGQWFVCFASFPGWDLLNHDLLEVLVPLESPLWVGLHLLVYNILTYGGEVIEYLKIHLNKKKKLKEVWDILLTLLESPWWVRFNEADLEIFGPKVWVILSFFMRNSIK
jgi:hypothetical protein